MAFLVSALLLAATAPGTAAPSVGPEIKLLTPGAFPHLPNMSRKYLRQRGCMIPQSIASVRPHNVISGEFVIAGRRDWAVLCSRSGVSTILIFQPGVQRPVAELAKQADRLFLQASPRGRMQYSRVLRPVGRTAILSFHAAYGSERTFRVDHDGVEDAFAEKASVVHYFHKGRWLKLQGAD